MLLHKLVRKSVVAALVAVCCSSVVVAGEEIKIGLAGPHTGDLAPYGLPSKSAAEMAVAEINAAGGIGGKKLVLVPGDDQCKPELATNVATKLVSEGVKVVIGHVCSGATKAALGIYKEAKVTVVSPSATAPVLTKGGEYPNFFRTIASDDEQAILAAKFAVETLKAAKVAVIHDKGDYGKGFADFARAAIEKSGKAKVVTYEGIQPGAMDYSAVLQKIRNDGADTVIFGGYHPEASKLLSQMKKKRMQPNFIGSDGIKGDGFIKIAGKDGVGAYATGPKDVSKNALNAKVREAHRQQFGQDPGNYFDQAYAATLAVANAIKVAGGTEAQALAKALRSTAVETPLGRIKFDARGDVEGVGFAVYQMKGSGFAEVR